MCANPRLTLITATNPSILTKKFHLTKDGGLVKTPGGPLITGLAKTVSITRLGDLAPLVASLTPSQAFCYGVMGHNKARIISQRKLTTVRSDGIPVIARTREFFTYAQAPGIFPIDTDKTEARHPDEIRAALVELSAELADAPMMIFASASSGIYHGENVLTELVGWRCLILVSDASDIARAGDVLFKRAWLKGKGWIYVSRSGAQLPRSIVDASVYQPERLDFVSGAYTIPPLIQQRPEPAMYNDGASLFDTRHIQDLTASETVNYETLIAVAKEQTRIEANTKRAAWIDRRIESDIKQRPNATAADKEKIRDTWQRASKYRTLHSDFFLETMDGARITVADILGNRERWDKQYVKDPVDPGDRPRARLFLLEGKPYLWAFSEGARFYLVQNLETVRIEPGARRDIVERLIEFARKNGDVFLRGNDVFIITVHGELLLLDQRGVLWLLDGLAAFQKYNERKKSWGSADCPKSYSEGFLAAAALTGGLPPLTGIITHPTIEPRTGRIIAQDGYDAQTGLLIRLGPEHWPDIPERPDRDAIQRAAKNLLYPFRLFPFSTLIDRGVFLSALLTAVFRTLLKTSPLFLLDANAPGTGKTLLARLIARLIGIPYPSIFPFSNNEDEMRKRLLSIFRINARVIVLDNIVGQLQSASLCAALTSPIYEDRILGVSEITRAPTNTLFLATGNNVHPAGDLIRRTLTCRINAKTEQPWTRVFTENPIEYVDAHRPELIMAALTILKGTFLSGFSPPESLGSFEGWNATVRAAVCYLMTIGVPDLDDPVNSIDTAYMVDPELGKLSALLVAWLRVFDNQPSTVAQAVKKAEIDEGLATALDEIAGEHGYVNSRRLGRWIERHRDRIVEGMCFEKTKIRTHGGIHWRIKVSN